jgi:hypothetical protein
VLGQEISTLTLAEKYQIMTAYMQGGGVQALLGEEEAAGGMSEEDAKAVEEQFAEIYEQDAQLRQVLQGQDPSTLNVKEKYEILFAYKKGGGVQGLLGGEEEEAEESYIEHNGMKFKRVQIEGEEQEYLMDEAGNIYDDNFGFIGQANNDEEEEAEE